MGAEINNTKHLEQLRARIPALNKIRRNHPVLGEKSLLEMIGRAAITENMIAGNSPRDHISNDYIPPSDTELGLFAPNETVKLDTFELGTIPPASNLHLAFSYPDSQVSFELDWVGDGANTTFMFSIFNTQGSLFSELKLELDHGLFSTKGYAGNTNGKITSDGPNGSIVHGGLWVHGFEYDREQELIAFKIKNVEGRPEETQIILPAKFTLLPAQSNKITS